MYTDNVDCAYTLRSSTVVYLDSQSRLGAHVKPKISVQIVIKKNAPKTHALLALTFLAATIQWNHS